MEPAAAATVTARTPAKGDENDDSRERRCACRRSERVKENKRHYRASTIKTRYRIVFDKLAYCSFLVPLVKPLLLPLFQPLAFVVSLPSPLPNPFN